MHKLEVLEKFHFVCEGNYKKEKKKLFAPDSKKSKHAPKTAK